MQSMKRRQASLYLPDQSKIESFRFRHNRTQALLIPPHVTLCREAPLAASIHVSRGNVDRARRRGALEYDCYGWQIGPRTHRLA